MLTGKAATEALLQSLNSTQSVQAAANVPPVQVIEGAPADNPGAAVPMANIAAIPEMSKSAGVIILGLLLGAVYLSTKIKK